MKKKLVLLFMWVGTHGSAQTLPPNNPNWDLVFSDEFNEQTSAMFVPSTAVLSYLDDKWVVQDTEKRYGCENVFVKEQLALQDGSLFLNVDYCPSGECLFNGNPLHNGQADVARFQGSELYTIKKFMFGYIEARVKLPSGRGTFPGFWLMPLYNERNMDFALTPDPANPGGYIHHEFKYGYPEEMDIIEQRAVYDANDIDHRIRHVNDFCSFWNGNLQYDFRSANPPSNQHYFENKLEVFEHYGSCNKALAGEWHTLALEWDLFGQKYYIDGELIMENNLWNRIVNTESMNVVFTNAIQHHFVSTTGDYDNTFFKGNKVYFPVYDQYDIDPYLKEEKVKVDWVKVFQQRKFNNNIVWASGKSDKIGDVKLNNSSNTPLSNVILVGDFVYDPNNGADEIFVMEDSGTFSELQRFTDDLSFYAYSPITGLQAGPKRNEKEVWQAKRLWWEDGNNQYKINVWNNPDLTRKTQWVVGNFDGLIGDEIFVSNNQSLWSAIKKFNVNADATNDPWPSEPWSYGGEGLNYIPYYFSNNTTGNRPNTENDRFVAGNFDTANAGNNRAELLCLNMNQSSNYAITLAANPHPSYPTSPTNRLYFWKRLNSTAAMVLGAASPTNTIWLPDSNDIFIAGNFDNSADAKDELFCLNKTTGLAALYKLTAGIWVRLWVSPRVIPNDTATPYCLNITGGGSDSWWLNAGEQSKFTFGKYLDNTPNTGLLMCVSENQQYANIYQFNPAGSGSWDLRKGNSAPANTALNNGFVCFPYKYSTTTYTGNTPSYAAKTRLLTIEKYYNAACGDVAEPDQPTTTPADRNNCVKYFTSLVSFNLAAPLPKSAAEPHTKTEFSEKTTPDLPKNLTITPNPSNDLINLSIAGTAVIYDMNGRLIMDEQKNAQSLSVKNLAVGSYIIKVTSEEGEFSAQFLKN